MERDYWDLVSDINNAYLFISLESNSNMNIHAKHAASQTKYFFSEQSQSVAQMNIASINSTQWAQNWYGTKPVFTMIVRGIAEAKWKSVGSCS